MSRKFVIDSNESSGIEKEKAGSRLSKYKMGSVTVGSCLGEGGAQKPQGGKKKGQESVTSLPSMNMEVLRGLARGELPGIVEEDSDTYTPKLIPQDLPKRKHPKRKPKTRGKPHVSPRLC